MASFLEYIKALKSSNVSFTVLVELLDESEIEIKPIWLDLYENSGNIIISNTNGTRRSASITLDNVQRKYDIDVNKLWIYQKLKISYGIQFVNSNGIGDTYLIPQGVYYINNPQNSYNPATKTITFDCVDKWARLDGRLGGKLEATYSFPKTYTDKDGNRHYYEYDMFDIIRNLLKTPLRTDIRNIAFIGKPDASKGVTLTNTKINTYLVNNGFDIYKIKKNEAVTDNVNGIMYYCNNTPIPSTNSSPTWSQYIPDNDRVIDRKEPLLNSWYYTDDVLGNMRVLAPYSITKKLGDNLSDILLEIAYILGASMFYDRTGRFVVEPTQADAGYLLDTEKELSWTFSENDGVLYDVGSINHDFENIYNQVIGKGTLIDNGTYTVWAQNNDPSSPISVDRIGVKTIVYDDLPIYDYRIFIEQEGMTEDEAKDEVKRLLREHVVWLLKKHTIASNQINIKCMPLPHLDVNQVVRVIIDDEPKDYLISKIELPLDPTGVMVITASSIYNLANVIVT